jgi:serine/threonine protein kinase
VPASKYPEVLHGALSSGAGDGDLSVAAEIRRVSLSDMLIHVADTLAGSHRKGSVHGDLKPTNILLSRAGVALIDDFELTVGQVAPGWTPDWSAPEQVLGAPVGLSSDVYPLGRMIADLLGGKLVGEVRKFKIAMPGGATQEFDVFYNPSLRCTPEHVTAPEEGLPAWMDLARRCLRFDPAERPQDAGVVAAELRRLSRAHPLRGNYTLTIDKPLVLAGFVDGTEGAARRISIDMTSGLGSKPPAPAPPPPLWPR